MIVADTCLVTHLFNETELTQLAQDIFKKDSSWILPTLWQEEYANVLSKLARKHHHDIEQVINNFTSTVDQLKDYEVIIDNERALRTALAHKISVYDAHFVTLAKDFKIRLVTEDKEILKNCPKIAINMREFLNDI